MYASLRECVSDLERTGQLVRIDAEIDPHLCAAEIQRRAYRAGAPAILFTRLRGCTFPAVCNLFGTKKRAEYIFRDSLESVRTLVRARVTPQELIANPLLATKLPRAALTLLPTRSRKAAVLANETALSSLPKIVSWPRDGGPFITLPEVYTEHPDAPGWRRSNLGMYRVQLSGNDYVRDREAGLHYQIHRSIGVHHRAAKERGERLRVNVHVGGPPAFALAAVMPLPEDLPEVAFAGALGGRRVRLFESNGPAVLADADFVIRGWIEPSETKLEGPFGDHLGYYSERHPFPLLHVESVHHRDDAIYPFTSVGRPPQEDTTFGEIIHEITGPLIPSVLSGVRAVHAVDAAGVHPLLLAIGSERYVPFESLTRPMEILTQASAILGQGQLSLAKYLFIAAHEDAPPDIHDIRAFLMHMLERVDPEADLHFMTNTTIDTLDYSGSGLNMGSKVTIAAAGGRRRTLATEVPGVRWPSSYGDAKMCMPGILALRGPAFQSPDEIDRLCEALGPMAGIAMIVVVDDSAFAAQSLENFLWVTFTRSNPAVDVHGIGARVRHKAWGCQTIVIDARAKPHHAPALEQDPEVVRAVDAMCAKGGPLAAFLNKERSDL